MSSQAGWIVFGVSWGLFNLWLGLWLGSVIMRRLNNKVIYWKDKHIAALNEHVAYLQKEMSDDRPNR